MDWYWHQRQSVDAAVEVPEAIEQVTQQQQHNISSPGKKDSSAVSRFSILSSINYR
jgi:hypothetical protein